MGGECYPALVYGFEHTEFLQMDDDSVFICFTGIPGNYIYATIETTFIHVLSDVETMNVEKIKTIEAIAEKWNASCKWHLAIIGDVEN